MPNDLPSAARRLTRMIPDELDGERLDQALARLLADYSRSRLQDWIRAGRVRVDGVAAARPRDPVAAGQQVSVEVVEEAVVALRPQPIPLAIVYADADLLVVDKPAGLVVHPAAGNPDGTLQNALLHYDPALAALPRAGIVHRLDKETSGLMVVARSPRAHRALVAQLQERTLKRVYRTVVRGVVTAGGRIDAPIGRHPTQRTRMAVVAGGKPAVTHYRVVERYRAHSLLEVRLETGRTHQIRVHMAHIRHPVVGDPVYGGRLQLPAGAGEPLRTLLRGLRRQALHAVALGLSHPETGEAMEWQSPLPADIAALIDALRADAA